MLVGPRSERISNALVLEGYRPAVHQARRLRARPPGACIGGFRGNDAATQRALGAFRREGPAISPGVNYFSWESNVNHVELVVAFAAAGIDLGGDRVDALPVDIERSQKFNRIEPK